MRIKNGYQDMVEQAKANVDDMVAEAAYITQSEAAADEAAGNAPRHRTYEILDYRRDPRQDPSSIGGSCARERSRCNS